MIGHDGLMALLHRSLVSWREDAAVYSGAPTERKEFPVDLTGPLRAAVRPDNVRNHLARRTHDARARDEYPACRPLDASSFGIFEDRAVVAQDVLVAPRGSCVGTLAID